MLPKICLPVAVIMTLTAAALHPAHADTNSNSLNLNGLIANGLLTNGLLTNGLLTNGLTTNGRGLNGWTDGVAAANTTRVISIELPTDSIDTN